MALLSLQNKIIELCNRASLTTTAHQNPQGRFCEIIFIWALNKVNYTIKLLTSYCTGGWCVS